MHAIPRQIPLYAAWKLWTAIIGPMMGFNNLRQTAPAAADNSSDGAEALSKKQQKAQKKAEKRNSTADSKLKRR